jgi:hypothetical protein
MSWEATTTWQDISTEMSPDRPRWAQLLRYPHAEEISQ